LTLLDRFGGPPERVVVGRYVLPGGARSRDPLGGPELKCNVDETFHASGPAVAVWVQGEGIVHPAAWMSLSGRPQSQPDRDTRGYFTPARRACVAGRVPGRRGGLRGYTFEVRAVDARWARADPR